MQCQALFQKIDMLAPGYIPVWQDVCNIESPSSCKEGVDRVAHYFAALARERGWQVEIFPQEISGDVACITLNPGASKAPVSLSAHLDTVHALGAFGDPPVHLDEEKIYGPGVEDCKGGAVAAFLAMDALDQWGFRDRPVQLLLQTDEEVHSSTSGQATLRAICQKAAPSIAFLNCEGCEAGTLVLRRKGVASFRITVTGKPAHAGICYNGANAIAEAAHKILQIEQFKDPDGLTCNCGVIQGGTVTNIVPAHCTFVVDVRYASQAQLDQARQALEQITAQTAIPGCTAVLESLGWRPAMEASEKNDALLRRMNEIYAQEGLPLLTPRKANGGSDAADVTAYGIPCVDSIGVEGGGIHTRQEFSYLASLPKAAKRIAAVVACL